MHKDLSFKQILHKMIEKPAVQALHNTVETRLILDIPILAELFQSFKQQSIASKAGFETYLKQSEKLNLQSENEANLHVNKAKKTIQHSQQIIIEPILKWSDTPFALQLLVVEWDALGGCLYGCNLSKTLVKKEFRKLAMRTHPDLNSDQLQSETAEKFALVKEKYDDLVMQLNALLEKK